MNSHPDANLSFESPTPDRLLHPRSAGDVSAEDIVLAAGRDITPKNLAWAERKLAEEGNAAIEKMLP